MNPTPPFSPPVPFSHPLPHFVSAPVYGGEGKKEKGIEGEKGEGHCPSGGSFRRPLWTTRRGGIIGVRGQAEHAGSAGLAFRAHKSLNLFSSLGIGHLFKTRGKCCLVRLHGLSVSAVSAEDMRIIILRRPIRVSLT